MERREAQAIHQCHIGFCRAGYNAFFQAPYHFVDHWDHHASDNLFITEFAFRLADFCQQIINGGILFFFRLALVVFFITPESKTVFLSETVSIKQGVYRVAIIFLHTLREACGHHCLRVMCGINSHHVQQISRAHRPAKLFFHDFIDFAEIRPIAQQLAETGKIREQHAVHEETGAVVDHNWRFAHLACPCDNFGDGFIRAFLAANDLNQWHAVYWVKEVHPTEVFRALERAGQLVDWDGRGIRRQYGVRAYLIFGFRQYRFFHFRVFHDRFNHHVHTLKTAIVEGWMNSGNHARHFQTVNFAALKLFVQQFGRFGHAQR